MTHYALAHPNKHIELHSATQALLVAPAVQRQSATACSRSSAAIPPTACCPPRRRGTSPAPGCPSRRRGSARPTTPPPEPGYLRLTGFVSKPELQKLNRNSIYVFVNQRLIRDRLVIHALTEAYRNVIPPTSFPVVLLFLEMPPQEVDVNVHPAKTEVRFRQSSFVHDFIRDTVRTALMVARPAAHFSEALTAAPHASSSLLLGVSPLPGAPEAPFFQPGPATGFVPQSESDPRAGDIDSFTLAPPMVAESPGRLAFTGASIPVGYDLPTSGFAHSEDAPSTLNALATLKPLGQLRDSFILAVNEEGLWIVDQHVAHERVLFEKILREREVEAVQRQRLLMPLLVDLLPGQMIAFAEIAAELETQRLRG